MIYDFLPNIDMKAYTTWAQKAIGIVLKTPGLVEFRATRNMLGSPQIKSTTVWKSAADWSNFAESGVWKEMETEMRTFVANLRVELWGPSPIVPEPLRP